MRRVGPVCAQFVSDTGGRPRRKLGADRTFPDTLVQLFCLFSSGLIGRYEYERTRISG